MMCVEVIPNRQEKERN